MPAACCSSLVPACPAAAQGGAAGLPGGTLGLPHAYSLPACCLLNRKTCRFFRPIALLPAAPPALHRVELLGFAIKFVMTAASVFISDLK